MEAIIKLNPILFFISHITTEYMALYRILSWLSKSFGINMPTLFGIEDAGPMFIVDSNLDYKHAVVVETKSSTAENLCRDALAYLTLEAPLGGTTYEKQIIDILRSQRLIDERAHKYGAIAFILRGCQVIFAIDNQVGNQELSTMCFILN